MSAWWKLGLRDESGVVASEAETSALEMPLIRFREDAVLPCLCSQLTVLTVSTDDENLVSSPKSVPLGVLSSSSQSCPVDVGVRSARPGAEVGCVAPMPSFLVTRESDKLGPEAELDPDW